MNRSTISALAILSIAGPALADDLTPPPWRFNPGTTVQHWDFSGGPAGGAADALPLNNPFGSPMMSPGSTSTWFPTFNGRPDVWNLNGQSGLSFDIPNTNNTVNQKTLWLQVTYFAPAPSPGPGYTVASPTGGPFSLLSSTVTVLPGGWTHELTQWFQPSCPPLERVSIFPSLVGTVVFIDQVVIDTQCAIPAPGASAALALGGLVAFRRRRSS